MCRDTDPFHDYSPSEDRPNQNMTKLNHFKISVCEVRKECLWQCSTEASGEFLMKFFFVFPFVCSLSVFSDWWCHTTAELLSGCLIFRLTMEPFQPTGQTPFLEYYLFKPQASAYQIRNVWFVWNKVNRFFLNVLNLAIKYKLDKRWNCYLIQFAFLKKIIRLKKMICCINWHEFCLCFRGIYGLIQDTAHLICFKRSIGNENRLVWRILGFIKGLDSFTNCYYEIDVRTESSEKQNKNMTRCQVINSAEQIIE